jgi:hypothetical protein
VLPATERNHPTALGRLEQEDKTIVIRDRKDPRKKLGNNQTVPLLGKTYEIIIRQPREENQELIFPVNGKSWSSLFPRACEELGIKNLQLYDLRHEAISRLVESGKYSIPEMMLVTGHKDPKQLMRYTQLTPAGAKDLHRVTGTVLDEWWGRTEDYARDKTVRGWGKRRFEQGEMRPLRVRLEALSPEEAAKERADAGKGALPSVNGYRSD